jgi:probable O-glycosylation ligase (exosortase A-associated)
MAAMGTIFWLRSRRKLPMAAMIAFVLIVMLPFMPEEWWSRMSGISEYQDDASAQGRFHAWHVAWQVATHHFFGGGMTYQNQFLFNLYGDGDYRVIAAHSIYFQILGNHGFIGLFIFLALWFATYSQATWLRSWEGEPNIPFLEYAGLRRRKSLATAAVKAETSILGK